MERQPYPAQPCTAGLRRLGALALEPGLSQRAATTEKPIAISGQLGGLGPGRQAAYPGLPQQGRPVVLGQQGAGLLPAYRCQHKV